MLISICVVTIHKPTLTIKVIFVIIRYHVLALVQSDKSHGGVSKEELTDTKYPLSIDSKKRIYPHGLNKKF